MQYTTTHCNTLQHTATHLKDGPGVITVHTGNTRQHTATCLNAPEKRTRRHHPTHLKDGPGIITQDTCTPFYILHYIATHCKTPQGCTEHHRPTHWKSSETHCNTLQHTATHLKDGPGIITQHMPRVLWQDAANIHVCHVCSRIVSCYAAPPHPPFHLHVHVFIYLQI